MNVYTLFICRIIFLSLISFYFAGACLNSFPFNCQLEEYCIWNVSIFILAIWREINKICVLASLLLMFGEVDYIEQFVELKWKKNIHLLENQVYLTCTCKKKIPFEFVDFILQSFIHTCTCTSQVILAKYNSGNLSHNKKVYNVQWIKPWQDKTQN